MQNEAASAVSHGLQTVPVILTVGLFTLMAYYLGKNAKKIALPSLIGYMITGVIFGNWISHLKIGALPIGTQFTSELSFLTDVVLSFVALTIGLELSFSSLRKQGSGIIAVIFTESFLAFFVVTGVVYLVTKNLPMALIFGSIAPASAPAGTVAIIQEYKAKGPLTKALFAVVGFDDGLGIIIFGFAAAIARSMIENAAGGQVASLTQTLLVPLIEVGGSILAGVILGILFSILGRQIKRKADLFIIAFAIAMLAIGVSQMFHLSLILTNMIIGMVVVNTQPQRLVHDIGEGFSHVMPLMYILFFTLAGANLHVAALPSLGLLGLVYILGRSFGLVAGARLGAIIGKMPPNIKNYLGMGILSQAGVAIGLSLMVKQDFAGIGIAIENHGEMIKMGTYIGATVLTTVTASSIIFEIIGPILTKIALTKAGEINPED
jgi:Kef-type K+ transport system membrane component KefB